MRSASRLMMCQYQTHRQTSVYVWIIGGIRFLQKLTSYISKMITFADCNLFCFLVPHLFKLVSYFLCPLIVSLDDGG